MTAIHATSSFNVKATLNSYFKTALTALSRPSWLSIMPAVVMNTPEVTASLPAFSFVHLSVGAMDLFQGRNAEVNTRAMTKLGILDLSAWVSRKAVDWSAQLETMGSMIDAAYLDSKGGVVIKDYQSSTGSPANVAYRIVLNDMDEVTVENDPNPDVIRRRYLIKYQWSVRSTN